MEIFQRIRRMVEHADTFINCREQVLDYLKYQGKAEADLIKDIVVDSQDAVIELKCSRVSMSERQLSEEVASDIIHYNNRHLYL